MISVWFVPLVLASGIVSGVFLTLTVQELKRGRLCKNCRQRIHRAHFSAHEKACLA